MSYDGDEDIMDVLYSQNFQFVTIAGACQLAQISPWAHYNHNRREFVFLPFHAMARRVIVLERPNAAVG